MDPGELDDDTGYKIQSAKAIKKHCNKNDPEYHSSDRGQPATSLSKYTPRSRSVKSNEKLRSNKHQDTRGFFTCNYPSCNKKYVTCNSQTLRQHIISSHLPTNQNSQLYSCSVALCSSAYTKLTALNTHYKHHWEIKPFPCPEEGCSSEFVTTKELRIHSVKHSDVRKFECDYCHATFKTIAVLNGHQKKKSSNLQCNICQEQFCAIMKFNSHMLGHKRQGTFLCNICANYIPVSDRRQHGREHFLKDSHPFQCKFCDKKFNCKSFLEMHIGRHTKEKPYSCKICGKDFNQRSNWRTHQKVHQIPEDKIQCPICFLKMGNQTALERHAVFCGKNELYFTTEEIPISPSELKPKARKMFNYIFRCKQCPKTVRTRKDYIQEHVIRNHLKIKCYSCYFCNAKLSGRGELQTHLRFHTGENPFNCKICGNAFSQATHLRRHMVVHTEERTKQCPQCPNKFKSISYLRRHIAVHTCEKPYKCEKCGKEFARQPMLKRHAQRHHLKEFPFKCGQKGCGSKFISKTEVKLHYLHVHSDERPFRCEVCDTAFKINGKLLEHKRSKRHMEKEMKQMKWKTKITTE